MDNHKSFLKCPSHGRSSSSFFAASAAVPHFLRSRSVPHFLRTSSALLPHFFRTSAALLLPHFFRSGTQLSGTSLLPNFFRTSSRRRCSTYHNSLSLFFNDNAPTTQQQINSFALPIFCHLEETRPPPVHNNRRPAVWCRAHTRRAAVLR